MRQKGGIPMKRFITYFATFIMVVLFFLLNKSNAYGQEIQEFAPETVAVSLVIDTSGSMSTNDPLNLRNTSAGIFIDLLSENDYLGIITFDTRAIEVLPLQKITNNENKQNFKERLSPYITARGDTNYKIALDEAANQLKNVTDPNIRKIIIFITDGAPDPNSARSLDEAFMNQYMETLWESVGELSKQHFEVYSIGFSDNIRKDILSQIAAETGGDFIILPDAGSLASSSFKILSELKNRKGFLDKTVALNDTAEFNFVLDEYTTQATMVMAGKENNDFTISVNDPYGAPAENDVLIIPGDAYTILVATNSDSMVNGTWDVMIKGTGEVDIFGDRDLNIKSWITEPNGTSHYQAKEPVPIKVNVTGKWKQGIQVIATIWHNGNGREETVVLEELDGVYQGVYEMIKQPGTYSVRIDVLLNEEIVTTQKKEFSVGIIPDLNYLFEINQEGYRLGENIPIQAWMNIGTTRIKQGGDLTIDDCYLEIIDSINNTSGILELIEQSESGLHSANISLDQIGNYIVNLIVSGTYKNERFMIRKEIGTYQVKMPGKITVDYPEEQILNHYGTVLSVPIVLINDSEFIETIRIKMNDNTVSIPDNKIKLEPGSRKELILSLHLDQSIKNTVHIFSIDLIPANQKTLIEPAEIKIETAVVTDTQLLINRIKYVVLELERHISRQVLFAICIVTGLIIAFLITGSLLYTKLYLSSLKIGGKLLYAPIGKELNEKNAFKFDSTNKKKIIVSFDEKNPNADFYIKGTGFQYSLIITAGLKKSNLPIASGWKTFLTRTIPVKYRISATEPGIIEKEGEFFTNKVLLEEDYFESGGYRFCYYWPYNKWNRKKKTGSNILAGKSEISHEKEKRS